MTSLTISGDYLRSDLGSFLWIYHADVFKVFESVLSVFLLSTHILLQHVEYVTRLQGRKRTKTHQFRMTQVLISCTGDVSQAKSPWSYLLKAGLTTVRNIYSTEHHQDAPLNSSCRQEIMFLRRVLRFSVSMNNKSPDLTAKLKEKKNSQHSCPVTIAIPQEEKTKRKRTTELRYRTHTSRTHN